MNNINVKIKLTSPYGRIPTRGSEDAAGWDIYAALENPTTIQPYTTAKIDAGFATEFPTGYFAAVYARSGLSIKQGLRLANTTGIIDADYRGNWIIALYNDSDTPKVVNPGDRIAQVIFHKFETPVFEETEELNMTERGCGGLGSTGKN